MKLTSHVSGHAAVIDYVCYTVPSYVYVLHALTAWSFLFYKIGSVYSDGAGYLNISSSRVKA